eukprot:scaffold12089_cov176-Ochromonas_danica.AAC.2
MTGARLRRVAHDDLGAGVGRVVLAGSFLAVHVAEGVGIALGELLVAHDLGEVALEEGQGGVQVQARSLEEEPVLQTTPVLDFVLALQREVQLLHAERHGRLGRRVHALECEAIGLQTRAVGEVAPQELPVDVLEERSEALAVFEEDALLDEEPVS